MKSLFIRASLSLAVSALLCAVGHADLTEGLSAYWTLDGDALDSAGALGSASNTIDDNGAVVGDAGSVAFGDGKLGQAAILNGAGYVSVPTSVDIERNSANLSISAWFRVDEFNTGWQTMVSKGEQKAYRIAREGGDTNSIAYAGGSTDLRGSVDVNDQEWHHVVALTDHTNALASYYVDGSLVETSETRGAYDPADGIAENDPPLDLFIGANPETDPPRQWIGGIDDLAIWDRVITESEIAYLYNEGVGNAVPEPGTGIMALSGLAMLFGMLRRRNS